MPPRIETHVEGTPIPPQPIAQIEEAVFDDFITRYRDEPHKFIMETLSMMHRRRENAVLDLIEDRMNHSTRPEAVLFAGLTTWRMFREVNRNIPKGIVILTDYTSGPPNPEMFMNENSVLMQKIERGLTVTEYGVAYKAGVMAVYVPIRRALGHLDVER